MDPERELRNLYELCRILRYEIRTDLDIKIMLGGRMLERHREERFAQYEMIDRILEKIERQLHHMKGR